MSIVNKVKEEGDNVLQNIKIWRMVFSSQEDENYMLPLVSFVLMLFENIFGASVMNSEPCILYNDKEAEYPMLIRNCTPVRIRTCATNLTYWCQFIYQLSHEMTHFVIRQYKTDKTVIIKWFEETICEAMSLYILHLASLRWNECGLYLINSNYGRALDDYCKNEYLHTNQSVLSQCYTLTELECVENTCEKNRVGRSLERNYLFDVFCEMPTSISEFVYYPMYMRGDLQVDFEQWTSRQKDDQLVPRLKAIQPKLAV